MRLAWKNIMARKWTTVKVTISLLAMIIIMCVFTAYSIAISDEYTKVIESYRAGHYLQIKNPTVTEKNLEKLRNTNGVGSVVVVGDIETENSLYNIEFDIDGRVYKCEHSIYNEDNIISGMPGNVRLHYGDFSVYDSDQPIYGDNELIEMNYRWGGDYCMSKGKNSVRGNEIIVSKALLEDIGFDGDIVGKDIMVRVDGGEYTVKVVGVTSDEFYWLTGNQRHNMIVSTDSEIAEALSSKTKRSIFVNIADYTQAKIIGESIVKMGYVNVLLGTEHGLYMATTVTIVSNILVGVMATVGLSIIIALTVNIIMSMRYMITKKANFYGMISAYGLKDYGIFNVLFFEMAYSAVIATIVAYLISYAILYLLNYSLSFMVGVGVMFTLPNFLITFIVATVFTLIIVLATTVVNYVTFTRRYSAKLLGKSINN